MAVYQNPVIKGYNPDPSICRVGKDYYLVTSTFEFFPGVPVYHSRNLTDWKMIGYCLTRDSQLPLERCRCSGGIYAPTIRYHDGTFYMITTNVSHGGNFIVYAENPTGPWSEPQWVDQAGIDPSLLFDEDGKVYFCGTHNDNGRSSIVLFQVNPKTGERLSEKTVITHGTGEKCPEAPHLYKINGWYYLMIAEGGTEYGHMETIFRSRNVEGPYESCPHNPLICHRQADTSPIQATGHGDLLEDENGNWWMVHLGIRPLGHVMLHNLGRETFLTPVRWEDGWPVVGEERHTAMEMTAVLPGDGTAIIPTVDFEDDFTNSSWKLDWNFVRNPHRERYTCENRELCLRGGEETLSDFVPTFMGVRQKEFEMAAETCLTAVLQDGGRAGLTAFYNMEYHYEVYTKRIGDCQKVGISWTVHGLTGGFESDTVESTQPVMFRVETGREKYEFYYRTGKMDWKLLGTCATAGLCTEGTRMMTFTGTYLGVFAEKGEARFQYFSAKEI